MNMAAIEDAERLVPWTEPNAAALVDERLEAAVLRALTGPVPAELVGSPLLRFANTDLPAVPLLDAVLDPPKHDHLRCDRCNRTRLSILDRLWVPSGASVVEVAVCWLCHAEFDNTLWSSSLVWSDRGEA